MRLSDYATLTFDCYGTLIDWETGISDALAPWLERAGVELERDRVLEAFAETESAQQAATPALRYADLLAEVHLGLAGRFEIAPDPQAAKTFGASVKHWPAFPNSAVALALPEAALPAGDAVQRRPRILRAQQREARRDLRCDLYRRGHRLL